MWCQRLPAIRLSLISLAALRPFNGRGGTERGGRGVGGFLVLQTRGNRRTDRPPRAIHATRLAILAGASIVWERRGQESTRHAYARLQKHRVWNLLDGADWAHFVIVPPLLQVVELRTHTHERWYLAAVQQPSPKLGQQNTRCQSIRR